MNLFGRLQILLNLDCLRKTFIFCTFISICLWIKIFKNHHVTTFTNDIQQRTDKSVFSSHHYKSNETYRKYISKTLPFSKDGRENKEVPHDGDSTNTIKIFYNHKSWWQPPDFNLCKTYRPCELIQEDYRRTNECSALLLNYVYLPHTLPHRVKNQMWVFVSHEPPTIASSVFKNPIWRHQFNWTLTYRTDSTFPFPWGHIGPSKHSTEVDFEEIYSQKTKDTVWMVSNCKTQSRREEYVKSLRKHIDVDFIGGCGNVRCPRVINYNTPDDQCRNFISQTYKFYLSFESSLCRDYITEKVFLYYSFRRHIIPVIRSGSNVKHLLPVNSYINADNFANAQELGQYLKELAHDKGRYIAMLKAKDAVNSETQSYTFKNALCSLCETLHENPVPKPSQIDLEEWNDNAGCQKPTDLS